MKKFCLLLVLVAGFFAAGCTPTESLAERNRRNLGVADMNLRELNEDWDHFWLTDRSSMLTQWHPHVGY